MESIVAESADFVKREYCAWAGAAAPVPQTVALACVRLGTLSLCQAS